MSFLTFFWNELKYRKAGYAANFIAVVSAVIVVVFVRQTLEASKRSIRLITKNMGQNLIVLHEDSDLESYYTAFKPCVPMPQAYVDTLAAIKDFTTTYHVAVLQKRETVGGAEAILTGALPVKGARASEGKKNPFIAIPDGTVRLGSEFARAAGLGGGDSITILGREYRIERVEGEKGTMDDYRVYMPLSDLQAGTDQAGKISAILSLECLCAGEPLSVTEDRIRRSIRRIMPDVKVITLRNIALARYETREVTEKYGQIVLALLFIATLLFIVVQSYTEAARKERESALMSAVGFPHATMLRMYGLKALVIALPASLAGYLLGQLLVVKIGPLFAKAKVVPDYSMWHWFFAGALVVILLGFVPAIVRSLRSDPFDILREE
jgi:ABC-type lipoprotein release transport system permease subunit